MLNDKNLYLFFSRPAAEVFCRFLVFQGLDYTNKLIAIFFNYIEIN